MNRLFLGSALAVALAIAPLATTPALSQAQKTWTAPKTAWGHPDIQGWFSNLSENGTPLERPDQFAGRKLEDIKGEELTALKAAAQQRTIDSFQGPLHAPRSQYGQGQPGLAGDRSSRRENPGVDRRRTSAQRRPH